MESFKLHYDAPPTPVELAHLPALYAEKGPQPAHLAACMAPWPEEAVERSDGSKTGKGYNTTGIGYQWIVDRMNAVFGIGSWDMEFEAKHWDAGQTSSGKPWFGCDTRGWLMLGGWMIHNETGECVFKIIARAPLVGGHVSLSGIDAEKGAITNGFKKAAAMLCGCGSEAYRGMIDDDNEQTGEKPGGRPGGSRGGGVKVSDIPNLSNALARMLAGLERILAEVELSDWERNFLPDYLGKFEKYGDGAFITAKQDDALRNIWTRVKEHFKDATGPVSQGAARHAEGDMRDEGASTTTDRSSEGGDEDDLPF